MVDGHSLLGSDQPLLSFLVSGRAAAAGSCWRWAVKADPVFGLFRGLLHHLPEHLGDGLDVLVVQLHRLGDPEMAGTT